MERGLNKIRRPSLIEGKTPRWASRLTPVGLRLRRWAVWRLLEGFRYLLRLGRCSGAHLRLKYP